VVIFSASHAIGRKCVWIMGHSSETSSKVARARAAGRVWQPSFERLDLLVAESLVVVLHAFVSVLLPMLQSAMDQSGEPVAPTLDRSLSDGSMSTY